MINILQTLRVLTKGHRVTCLESTNQLVRNGPWIQIQTVWFLGLCS